MPDNAKSTKGPKISRVERQSVSEQVAQQLIGMIHAGSFKPGSKLPPERELAPMLDVSRPSLREALRGMSMLGLVRIRQGGGVYVSELQAEELLGPLHYFISLDDSHLADLFEARIAIESTIAGLAAQRISDEQLAKLAALIQDESSLVASTERFIEADVAFHQLIFDAAQNSLLIRMAKSLHVLGEASRRLTSQVSGMLEATLVDHRRILNALQKRSKSAAERAMRTHLVNVRNAYYERGTSQSSRKTVD